MEAINIVVVGISGKEYSKKDVKKIQLPEGR